MRRGIGTGRTRSPTWQYIDSVDDEIEQAIYDIGRIIRDLVQPLVLGVVEATAIVAGRVYMIGFMLTWLWTEITLVDDLISATGGQPYRLLHFGTPLKFVLGSIGNALPASMWPLFWFDPDQIELLLKYFDGISGLVHK